MSGYIQLAETALYKNGKLTIINAFSELKAIAMPAEFKFDMVIMCGPKWSEGDHQLTIKVRANDNEEEQKIAESTVKIPHENFVYSAIATDVKFTMNYDVKSLTFTVYDNDTEVISRVYPVIAMFVPKQQQTEQENPEE